MKKEYLVWKVTYSCPCPGERQNSRLKQQYIIAAETTDAAKEQADIFFGYSSFTLEALAQGTVKKTVVSYHTHISFPVISGERQGIPETRVTVHPNGDVTLDYLLCSHNGDETL